MVPVFPSSYVAPVTGAGLGLRRSLLRELESLTTDDVQFMEIAPENWIGMGGRFGKALRRYTERFPFVCHGLSLSLGSPAPLNTELLQAIKVFMREQGVRYYSEHLSYSSDDAQLYDLLPIPFTEEAVDYVAERIQRAQDLLGERIAIENASYYCAPQQEMSEADFINAVLNKADCALLLDVNNLYVNSINQGYDPLAFLLSLPGERIAYLHIAGHYREAEDLLVDTHGTAVSEPVWDLLQQVYQRHGAKPTLLERDFNMPPVAQLMQEVERIKSYQVRAGG